MPRSQPPKKGTHKKVAPSTNPRAVEPPDTSIAKDFVEDANANDQKPAAAVSLPKKPSSSSSNEDVQRHVALYLFDIIDFIQEDMIRSRNSRKEQTSVLSYFWSEFSKYAPIRRGRMFVRSKLVQVLLDACSEPATSREPGIPSLIRWPAKEWYEFMELLEETRTACLHHDGTQIYWDQHDSHSENDTETSTRPPDYAMNDCFHQKFETVMRLCKLQASLAPIRSKLERQIQSTDGNEKPTVHPKRVEQIFEHALQESDPILQNWLSWLFEQESCKTNNEGGHGGTMIRPILKTRAELKVILKECPFNLDWIQESIEHLIQTWNFTCFGSTESALHKINYSTIKRKVSTEQPATSLSANAQIANTTDFEILKEFREALGDQRGDEQQDRGSNLATHTTQEHQNPAGYLTSVAAPSTELDMELDATPSRKNIRGGSVSERKNDQAFAQKNSDIETLKRFRDELGKNHGDDPREEARRLAAQATQGRRNPPPAATIPNHSIEHDERSSKKTISRGSFYEIKKSHTSLQFSDSDDEVASPYPDSDRDENDARHQRKRLKFAPPDEGRFDSTGRVLVKIKFTEEEDEALKEGIKLFGVGKWAKIKYKFPEVLRNRTSVMIKDRYRNLLKQGRIDPDPPESVEENDNKENEE